MNKTIRTLAAVMGSVACFAAPSVQAAPQPTLSFLQPSGTVGPNDTIDVRLRLTAGDLGLHFDNANPGAFLGYVNDPNVVGFDYYYTSIGSLSATVNYACDPSFNFDNRCSGGSPYNLQWGDGFTYLTTLDLNPGQSYDYLLGSFLPSAGPVPAGTYQLLGTSAAVWLSGTEYGPLLDAAGSWIYDANGDPVYGERTFTDRLFTLATTCTDPSDTGCGFRRTVVGGTSVPEPGSLALMLAAFGGLVSVRRKAGQRQSTIEA